MRFEWDDQKRRTNVRKHGIDFAAAVEIFSGDTLMIEDDRFDYGERRFISLGLLRGQVIVVAHTEEIGLLEEAGITEESSVIRIISARKATNYERRIFYERIDN